MQSGGEKATPHVMVVPRDEMGKWCVYFSAAVSRHGYAESTRSRFKRVDKQFQDFVEATGSTLIDSVAHTTRDLVRGSSAPLDHIITWNLTIESNSEIHGVSSDHNNHALIS